MATTNKGAPLALAIGMGRQPRQPRYPGACITLGRENAGEVLSAAVERL
jgi:hypothetical protein